MAYSNFALAEDSNIPKWKIALAVGGAVALGAGIYYTFYKSTSAKPASQKTSSAKLSKTSNGNTVTEKDDSPLGIAKQHKAEGNDHFRNGRYVEAIDCYDQAIEACPKQSSHDLSTFYQNRAAAYEHEKDYSSVLRDCSSALELNQKYTKALLRRARAAEFLKDLDLALEDYTAICIIEAFSNQESLTVVDRLLKQLGTTHAKEIFAKRREKLPSVHTIRSYMSGFCSDPVYNSVHSEKEGDGDEAEDMPEKHSVTGGYLRARQQLRDEEYSEIIASCDNELANPQSPYTAHALLLRGTMHVLYVDKDAAVADFTTLSDMEKAPTKFRVAALVKLGSFLVANNETETALVNYNRALNMDKNNPDIYHQRGQMHLMMNGVDEAIENFDKVVELSPDFAIGYVQKLHTDYRYASFKRDTAGAAKVMKQFEAAKLRFPKSIEVHLLLAQIMLDEEKFDEADAVFKDLLKVDPCCPMAYVYHAMLQMQWKGDIEGAKALINKALEMDPLCEMALENLAAVHVQTGNLAEGVKLFDRAIELAKSLNEMAHYCSLRDAAVAQIKVVKRLGITLPDSSRMY